MTMLSLAANSLRFRLGRFTATFINVFLGAVVLTAFASLFATNDRTTGMTSFMENGAGKATFEGR